MNISTYKLSQALEATCTNHVNSLEQGVSITQNHPQPLLEPTKVTPVNGESKPKKKFFTLPYDRIVENELNFFEIPPALLEKRTKSIRENGLRTRLKITDHPHDKNKYLLYGGHCNFKAGKAAEMMKFPVEYTYFETKEEMFKALVLDNEYRSITKKDEANLIKYWKGAWGKPQGSRSHIKGEGPTDTRKRLAKKFDMGVILIDQTLNVLKKRENLFHLMDKKMLSIGGADNIIKLLEKKGALHIPETQMIQLVIDAVIPINPKINEDYRSGKIPLEIAFRDSASSLGKLMEAPQVNQTEAVVPQNITVKSEVTENSAVAASIQNNKMNLPESTSVKNHGNNKVRLISKRSKTPIDIVQPAEIKDNDAVNGDNIKSNGITEGNITGFKQEAEPIKVSEDINMSTTQPDTISTIIKTKSEINADTVKHEEPLMLYVKDGTGNFVPYICKCETCPLNKQ